MKIKNLTINLPLGPFFSKYSLLFSRILNNRIAEISIPVFSFPVFLFREYLTICLITNNDISLKNLEKILFRNIGKTEFNLDEVNNLARSEKLIPYNYIEDFFYNKTFPLLYSNSIYDVIKEVDTSRLNKVFKSAVKSKIIIIKDISTKKIHIAGDRIENQIDLKIKPAFITDTSVFKSAYILLSFMFPKGLDSLINAFLVDSYLELIFRKDLMYTNEIVYRFDSDVVCHYFGTLVNILLSGFEIGNKNICTKVKNLIDLNPELPIDYMKNRALGKIYMNFDYEPTWSRFYSQLYTHGYNIDKIVYGIKQTEKINLPKSNDMFGILLN